MYLGTESGCGIYGRMVFEWRDYSGSMEMMGLLVWVVGIYDLHTYSTTRVSWLGGYGYGSV